MTAHDAGVAERAVGGLSLLGGLAELILMATGIYALGRAAAGRLSARWAAANAAERAAMSAARKMAVYEGEVLGQSVARAAAEPLTQVTAAQVEKVVEQGTVTIARHLADLLGPEALKKMSRDQFAGAVMEVIEKTGKIASPEYRELVFNTVTRVVNQGVRWLDPNGIWRTVF